MKHTPGPWNSWQEPIGQKLWRIDHKIPDNSIIIGWIGIEPNARLISAAPELLEAASQAQCECSVAERDSGHKIGCWMPALSAAIKKATE